VDVIKLVIGKGHKDRRGRSPAEGEPVDLVPVVICRRRLANQYEGTPP
jgi:hypothetical protein